jgi:hypothetical protein
MTTLPLARTNGTGNGRGPRTGALAVALCLQGSHAWLQTPRGSAAWATTAPPAPGPRSQLRLRPPSSFPPGRNPRKRTFFSELRVCQPLREDRFRTPWDTPPGNDPGQQPRHGPVGSRPGPTNLLPKPRRRTGSGWPFACTTDKRFARLAESMGRCELASSSLYGEQKARLDNRHDVNEAARWSFRQPFPPRGERLDFRNPFLLPNLRRPFLITPPNSQGRQEAQKRKHTSQREARFPTSPAPALGRLGRVAGILSADTWKWSAKGASPGPSRPPGRAGRAG